MADKKKSSGSGALAPIENIYTAVVSAIPLAQMKTWTYAYFHPVSAFDGSKKEANWGGIALHLVLIGLVAWVASMLSYVVGLNFAMFGIMIAGVIITPLMMLIGGFIGSAIYWVIAKIFGGKGSFTDQTLALALIYGGYTVVAFPFTVLAGIIGIGFIFGLIALLVMLYWLYDLYLVTKDVHQLSSTRAVIVVLVPIILAIIVAVVFAAVFAAMLGGAALGAAGAQGMGY